MLRSSILAHRGWWLTETEKNSLTAFNRALDAGFGIETDFRDCEGRVVITHDMPQPAADLCDASDFFSIVSRKRAAGRIAINVKADGLQNALKLAVAAAGLPYSQLYAFDMAVPDALEYLRQDFPAYTRISEYEDSPSFVDRAVGVWVDNFSGDFPQVTRARALLDQGMRAAIVSPELHRRDHRPLWEDILAAGLHKDPLFELCTDLPEDAATYFEASTE